MQHYRMRWSHTHEPFACNNDTNNTIKRTWQNEPTSLNAKQTLSLKREKTFLYSSAGAGAGARLHFLHKLLKLTER